MEEKKFDITKVSPDTGEKHYILTGEEKEKSRYGKLVFEFPKSTTKWWPTATPLTL